MHNRVSDIDRVARDLRDLVPEARVAVAHGQMDEGSLETVVLDFWERRYDVLVCTTIIESGIDMPSVNTLIVDRADLLGLGQLHQIRGRVGRGGQRAYAYLFHPADRVLSEQAYERLRTIGEHTELGSGFKIAMRDLEIRGAGNLLGSDQSGHIAAVGYDLYVQLVAEAVAEARGEPRPDAADGLHRRPRRRAPAQGLRGGRGRPPRGVPPPGRGHDARPTSTTSAPSGPTATARCPPPAEGLLALARLRASALARGIGEVAMSSVRPGGTRRPMVRLSPVALPASAQVRLRRAGARAPPTARTWPSCSFRSPTGDSARRRRARRHRGAAPAGRCRGPAGTPCRVRGA